MKFLLICLALLWAAPALADAQCITAKEYLTLKQSDLDISIPTIGDVPDAVEIEEWRFNLEETFLFIDLFRLPFAAERISFYGAPGGETVVVAAFWSGCLTAAIEISRAEAVDIVEMIKGPQS